MVAPYWGDANTQDFGEIWYETHATGLNSNSDTLLTRVSDFVRLGQNLTSFEGSWMIVATWNGTVPYGGTGLMVNLFG